MRFSDFLAEDDMVRDAVIDIITIMAGEETHSLPLEAIQAELESAGIDIDNNALFDLLDTLPIVDNIQDDVVFFNVDGPAHAAGMGGEEGMDAEQQQGTVKSMAQKQVQKGLDK